MHNFSGVVTLRLERVFFNDMSTLVEIVCSFPRLQTLSIKGDIGVCEPPSTTLQPSPHLVALELDIFGLDKILEWFLTLAVLPSFRSICLYHYPRVDVVVMQKFIAAFNESLEHLSIPIYGGHARSLLIPHYE
jgi:hypothetical protein